MAPGFPRRGASDFDFENWSSEGRALLFVFLILQEIRRHRLTIPYRRVYGAQHHTPRRRARNRINKGCSKVSKDQGKNDQSTGVKPGNDRSGRLQLLTDPFNDWPRLAEQFILEGNQTKRGNLALGLAAQHEVKSRSDRLRVVAVSRPVGQNPDERDDRIGTLCRRVGVAAGKVEIQFDRISIVTSRGGQHKCGC